MCPGPAIVSFGATSKAAGLFLPYLLAGMVSHEVMLGKGIKTAAEKSKTR